MKQNVSNINIHKYICICRQNNKRLRSNTTKIQQALERQHYKSLQKFFSMFGKSDRLWSKTNSKNIDVDTTVECLAKTPAFISVKDHKTNLMSSHLCCSMNPCKSEHGKISKTISDKTNVRYSHEFTQSKSVGIFQSSYLLVQKY